MISVPHINMLLLAIGGLLLVCLMMFIIILRLQRDHRRLKAKITETHNHLEQMVEARTLNLRQAGQAISESIDYASRLQRGLLPSPHTLEDALGKVAVFWQPKDVVGGDFYWFGRIGTARVLVIMDCTGHGVPGAFMTILAHSVIEQICSNHNAVFRAGNKPPNPASILKEMHDGIIRLLHRNQDEHNKNDRSQNGLDAAVVVLSEDEDQMSFAGAMIDLYVVPPGGLTKRHQGNRVSLGYGQYNLPTLKKINLPIQSGHSYILSTDGLLSQPGQDREFGFGYRRLTAHLTAAAKANGSPDQVDISPSMLGKMVMRALRQWQGNQSRRDDVTVIIFQPKP
jgi:serine phosphatase RsbU (regulator of sigma subunit)